jgi:hypothetical protein
MKTFLSLALIAVALACSKTETATQTETPALEKTYTMNGVLISRDAAKNTVNIDNEDVPGVMAPMKMDYEVRGARVDALPPDGTKVTMTLHDQNGTYWLSDVKARQ